MARQTSYTSLFSGFLPALLIFLASCANPVAPSGGPKDTTPPEIIKEIPANQSVNFSSDRVILTFSEFVMLKDIANQMVVSPPMAEQPVFTTRGKSLIMKLEEPLRSNTTYNFFFGNSIVDITEGNPLAGFQFTFSTGPILDSLTIGGKLIDAYTNKPVKDAFVMLYDSIYDSIPYKSRPYYIARTGNSGEFNLNNLRDNKYLMFAITDINADYMYNLPNEDIAFADSLIRPHIPVKPIIETDTTKRDSITEKLPNVPVYTLRHFRESDSVQKLLKTSLLSENVISIVFKYPVKKPVFTTLQPVLTGDWNITGYNKTHDTLTLWLPGSVADSLKMVVADSGYTNDTVELSLKPREVNFGRNKQKSSTEISPKLGIKHNLVSSRIKPYGLIHLNFSEPLTQYDFSKITLIADSILLKPDFEFEDSIKTTLKISHEWKEGQSYQLILNDSAFAGVFGHYNDSIAFRFSAFTEAETSSLKLLITIPKEGMDYIIQLMTSQEKIVEQKVINSNSTINFTYLKPDKYRVKVIYDTNRNGRWDTGNYLKKRQPEYIDYHPKEFELRANWVMEEDWAIPPIPAE